MNVFILFFASLRKFSSFVNIGFIAMLKLIISIDFIKTNLERQGKSFKSLTEEFLKFDKNQDQFYAEFMFGVYLFNIYITLVNVTQIIINNNILYEKKNAHYIIFVFALGIFFISTVEKRYLSDEKVEHAISCYETSDKKLCNVLSGFIMFFFSLLFMVASFILLVYFF